MIIHPHNQTGIQILENSEYQFFKTTPLLWLNPMPNYPTPQFQPMQPPTDMGIPPHTRWPSNPFENGMNWHTPVMLDQKYTFLVEDKPEIIDFLQQNGFSSFEDSTIKLPFAVRKFILKRSQTEAPIFVIATSHAVLMNEVIQRFAHTNQPYIQTHPQQQCLLEWLLNAAAKGMEYGFTLANAAALNNA